MSNTWEELRFVVDGTIDSDRLTGNYELYEDFVPGKEEGKLVGAGPCSWARWP